MPTTLKILSYIAKAAGFVAALNAIPFVSPSAGVIIFFSASLLKDTVDRIVRLSAPGRDGHVFARPVDYGPGDGSVIDGQPTRDTRRLADLSPGAATALGLQTDDLVTCEWVG